jgi:fatty-acyl-CoA synthase
MSFTITSALRWWSLEQPDAIAVSVDDLAVTFGELQDWTDRISGRLEAQGVKPGERIGVFAANALNYCALVLGALKVGAIIVPLNFRLTPNEVQVAMEDTTPALLFADEERRTAIAELSERLNIPLLPLERVGEWRNGPEVSPAFRPQGSTPACIIFTSGSTARPKGVVYLHGKIATYACEFGLTEPSCARGARTLNCAPFSASSGFLLFLEYVVLGCTQFIESRFDPERAMEILVRERITNFQAAPIFFERLSRTPAFPDADLSGLKFTQISGARIDPALLETWRRKGVLLRPGYGQTEAGGGWAARGSALDDPRKCGRGGLFTEFATIGEHGVNIPGHEGEILIQGPTIMIGYWNNDEATKLVLEEGWLRTGDLGVMDESGNLTFVDRLKDIIISGGLNISAAEVEYIISQFPGVEEVAVIAAQDSEFGETPMAIVFGVDAESEFAIVEHCNKNLSNYKVPRYVVIYKDPLPRLASGKIDKPTLRRRFQDSQLHLDKVR